ncbi:hypothetical protein Scep_003770 [Stephania cephalantha]|uniref:SAWADEE domain-containing protein n=1 Tax=Stephania cephalantha TaxID=152367 RepID=A0AAP0PYD5_9MAGN
MEESTDVELEFMRLDDSSWHPCRVSLSPDTSTGFGLIVEFGSHDSQRHVIHTKEEALACLRVRSIALQGGDCLDIKEGKHVLACQKTPLRSVLFDAVVEQVARVRHSKRSLCRCTFVVKWLQSDLHGGTETLPSNSILKLVVKSIDSYPTVHKFFTTVESLGSLGESPFPSFLEDTFCVSDLSSMVEKQVEEIHKLADASRSGSSEEILLVLKKDEAEFTGQARKVSFSGERTSQVQNNSKRTTRSASKTKQKTKDISPPPIEPEPDNRQHLSPLGARAALASLMSKLSQEAEFSISHLESKDFSDKSLGIHGEHSSVVSIDVVDKLFRSGTSFKEDVAVRHKLFPRLETRQESPDEHVSKHTMNAKIADDPHKYSQKKVSSVSKNKVQKSESSECIGSDPANVKISLTCLVSDGKENGPLRSTRVTRSSVQKGLETSNGKSEAQSSAEEMKSSLPVRGTRLTRSMIKNEVQILSVKNKQGLEGKPAQSALSDSIDGVLDTPPSNATKRKKSVSSSVSSKGNFTVAEENKKLRMSNDATTTMRTEGHHDRDAAEDDGTQMKKCNPSHQVKRSILKNAPQLRSSPRLSFLPRTRSEKC